jgi:hypothetical protein
MSTPSTCLRRSIRFGAAPPSTEFVANSFIPIDFSANTYGFISLQNRSFKSHGITSLQKRWGEGFRTTKKSADRNVEPQLMDLRRAEVFSLPPCHAAPASVDLPKGIASGAVDSRAIRRSFFLATIQDAIPNAIPMNEIAPDQTLDQRPPGAAGDGSADDNSARHTLGFWSLVVTQFQGAFNDNALKFLVIYLVVDLGLPQRERDWLVLVVGALFALPFILFSMTGGFLADRYSKRSVTIGTKLMEVGAMIFALVALARGSFLLETIGVFILSSQAALFGPSKYGLLPEILPEKDLSWGNGIIELGTFLASITATVAAGFLAF